MSTPIERRNPCRSVPLLPQDKMPVQAQDALCMALLKPSMAPDMARSGTA